VRHPLYAILRVERNSGGDINNHCGRSYISVGSRGYITRGIVSGRRGGRGEGGGGRGIVSGRGGEGVSRRSP
jgi:hypothetical protein